MKETGEEGREGGRERGKEREGGREGASQRNRIMISWQDNDKHACRLTLYWGRSRSYELSG